MLAIGKGQHDSPLRLKFALLFSACSLVTQPMLQRQPNWTELRYREFSPNANFITVNFIVAVFQNFPDKFCYSGSMYILLCVFTGPSAYVATSTELDRVKAGGFLYLNFL